MYRLYFFVFLAMGVMAGLITYSKLPDYGDLRHDAGSKWHEVSHVMLRGGEEWEYRIEHNSLMSTSSTQIMAFEAELGPRSISTEHSFRRVMTNDFVDLGIFAGMRDRDGTSIIRFKSEKDQLIRIGKQVVLRGGAANIGADEGYRANLCASFGCERPMSTLEAYRQDGISHSLEMAFATVATALFVMFLIGIGYVVVTEKAKQTENELATLEPDNEPTELDRLQTLYEEAIQDAEDCGKKLQRLPLDHPARNELMITYEGCIAEAEKYKSKILQLQEELSSSV